MPNIDDVITEIEQDEGGDKLTNDPADGGGRTQYGIAEKSNPQAWADGKVTETEARDIYKNKYFIGPGFDKIPYTPLQAQLTDYGVTSGPAIAISKLQGVLGILVDGKIGPGTLDAVIHYPNPVKLNNLLVGERIKMIAKIIVRDPSQIKFLSGWINRALEFLV